MSDYGHFANWQGRNGGRSIIKSILSNKALVQLLNITVIKPSGHKMLMISITVW